MQIYKSKFSNALCYLLLSLLTSYVRYQQFNTDDVAFITINYGTSFRYYLIFNFFFRETGDIHSPEYMISKEFP